MDEISNIEIENKLYSIAELTPYKAYKVEFRKNPIKPDGVYFQYNNGCVLYSLINLGYLDENDIPSSMKKYKNHSYAKDEKTHKDYLIRVLSLLDLAQLWINLGGQSPYKEKETQKEIKLEQIKDDTYKLLKNYVLSDEKKMEDIIPALNLVKNHERFATIIGDIKIKSILLSECEFSKDLEKINLKSAIDKGFIKNDEVVFCLNHYIAYNKTIEEDSKKIYCFTDSLPIFYEKLKKEGGENCLIDEDSGIIKASDNAGLINLEQTEEKRIGILKLLF
jgi:hypothetical protein